MKKILSLLLFAFLSVNAQHKGATMMSMMKGVNLSQYMDLANLHSKDASQFTLVSSKISSWNDGISAWTQGTDANRPTLTGGIPIFDGSNDQVVRSAEISTTVFSMYLVLKDTGAIGKIFLSAQSASDYMVHTSFSGGAFDGIGVNVGGVSKAIFRAGIKGNRYSILSIRRDGNTLNARLNDRVLIQTTNTFAGQNTLIARMMSFVSGGFAMAGGVKAFCMSSQNLSDAVDLQVRNKLYSDYNLAADTAAENVVGFGDSNTVGTGSISYLVSLGNSLGVRDANAGISGSLCSASDAASGVTRYQAQVITRPYTDYVVIQYGTNDIMAGVSAATYASALNTIVGGLISAGYNPDKICLVSCPYQRSGANATALDNYRTEILSISTTYGTKYFDLLQDMRDNGGDTLLVTGDNVHLNNTAQGRWAAGVLAVF